MIFVLNNTSLVSLSQNAHFNWMNSLSPIRDALQSAKKCKSCKSQNLEQRIPDQLFKTVVLSPEFQSEKQRLKEALGVVQLQIIVAGHRALG